MDFDLFCQELPKERPILGLDLGKAKIGIALSDFTWTIATPFAVWQRQSRAKDLEAICQLIETEHVGGVVCGLPLALDGTETKACHANRRLCALVHERHSCPYYMHDERFSTSASTRSLKEQGMRRKKRDQIDDKVAASLILQTVLDRLNYR